MTYSENNKIESFVNRQGHEDALEPDLPIIDPHHHLWDNRASTSIFEQKLYLCDEIMTDINESGHNITQTVFAQCGAFYRQDGPEEFRPVGETEFAQGVAAMSRSGAYGSTRLCSGIFGFADLRAGTNAESVLQAHLTASSNFRGIRTAFPSDLNSKYLEGFALLAKHELSFDHYSPDFKKLPLLAKLASSNPDVTVIVNHLGGTVDLNADKETFVTWKQYIKTVAASQNTVMKLGGAQMRVGSWEPHFHMNRQAMPSSSDALCELLFPHYMAAIEAFGPDRCMFESNFPVDKECLSYRTIWNLFKKIAKKAGLSKGEKASLFHGTAARVYRLLD